MRVPRHGPRATGTVLLTLVLSVLPGSAALLAQDAATGEGAVNQELRLDMARFKPFEIEYEHEAEDGQQVVTTVSYKLDLASGPEPLIIRHLDTEYFDWSGGFPRKHQHYAMEVVARAEDLRPVRTNVVNLQWDGSAASWSSERMIVTFSPGHVSSRYESTTDTTVNELAIPDGILQAGIVALAMGLHEETPQELVLTSYDWLDNAIDRERYDATARDSLTVAGRTYDVIIVEGVDLATSELLSRIYYRADIPRIFLGTTDPESSVKIIRVKEGM